jgi:Carboxypeptidase regulatory-like domain
VVKGLNAAVCATMLFASVLTQARDCSTSKHFRLPKPQVLAGALEDEAGAVLSGVEIELLSARTVIKKLRTDNDGHYDFGRIEVGTYRLRVEYSGKAFCAPEPWCDSERCNFNQRLILNPKIPPVKVE